MGEVVSLTRIIAVVEIAEAVISGCYAWYEYYQSIQQAESDIIAILGNAFTLKSVLADLHTPVKENAESPKHGFSENASLEKSLKSCEEVLKKVIEKLGIATTSDGQVTVTVPNKLTWRVKRDEIKRMTQTLEEHKSTFILALSQAIF